MVRQAVLATVISLGLAGVAAAQAPATSPADEHPYSVNGRLENQHDRIVNGKRDDQLTRSETTHLRADDAAIRAQERVYRQANDGRLTNGERRQLNHELNRSSRQIYRDRHNNRRPK